MKSDYNISFIGAGNVATNLSKALKEAGNHILTISSLNKTNAERLAQETGADVLTGYTIPPEADIVILAVNDSSVKEVASCICCTENTIVVHTAGSVPLAALGRDSSAGVFYPLQTFTRGREVDLKQVPFFVEATDRITLELLNSLALSVGASSYQCDSEKRKLLHLAAVFINNFPNFMLTIGGEISSRAGFEVNVLHPLMKETFQKAVDMNPATAQTGPARRGDFDTIKNHLELLSFSSGYQDLYAQLSKMIMNYYNTDNK